ncbi:hypothetical protein ACFL2V_13965, partial [Pseudomonadota bacterium]
GIQLPRAYKIATYAERSDFEVSHLIRWFRHNIVFVFNPDDPDYAKFLEQCKRDERELRKALEVVFKGRGINLRVNNKRARGQERNIRKCIFFIRPPFLASQTVCGIPTSLRANQGSNESNFFIHVDENGKLDEIRGFTYGETMFQSLVVEFLSEEPEFISENYGNWEAVAGKIADAVEFARKCCAQFKGTKSESGV